MPTPSRSLARTLGAGALLLVTGCVAPMPEEPDPRFEIPSYGADDPRAATVGFANKAVRARRRVRATEYTVMAFAVDEVVTVAAMVKGAFVGTAHVAVGPHRIALDFPRDHEDSMVAVVGDAAVEKGRARVFETARWVELDLPRAWWADGATPLDVVFEPAEGDAVELPRPGETFTSMIVPAPR